VLYLTGHIKEIKQLCDKHNVKTLFAFGSVTTDKFTPQSDIDLLIDIDIEDPLDYTDNYFAVKFQLEKILKRQIDLLEERSLRNPYLKKQIDQTKVQVYGR
jgi:predicted nucleotidyltransferase